MSDQPTEVVDAQVVEEAPASSRRQVMVQQQPVAPAELFPGATPEEIIQKATAVANALKPILAAQQMTTRIGNKDHVQIEGWQTLGALLKVTPVCASTRRIEPKVAFEVKGKKKKWGKVDGRRQVIEEFDYAYEVEGYSWEATVEARTLDGAVIGRADALCSRQEDKWKDDDDFALLSMAQTRASSKALASVLRFIVTLAGYSGTPAEEMAGHGGDQGESAPHPRKAEPVIRLNPERTERIISRFATLKLSTKAIGLMLGACGIDAPSAWTAEAIRERIAGLGEVEADKLEAELEATPALDPDRVQQLLKGYELARPIFEADKRNVNALDGFNVLLGTLGIDGRGPGDSPEEHLARLTEEQADALDAELQKLVEQQGGEPDGE